MESDRCRLKTGNIEFGLLGGIGISGNTTEARKTFHATY
jgi:hypothetical protein|tara:strand:- start:501 stop:617 length:117 start_codon:yes stop_codon:yes gene_type:complete